MPSLNLLSRAANGSLKQSKSTARSQHQFELEVKGDTYGNSIANTRNTVMHFAPLSEDALLNCAQVSPGGGDARDCETSVGWSHRERAPFV